MLESVSPSTVTSALSRFVNSMESHLKYKQHFLKKVKLILNFTWSRKYLQAMKYRCRQLEVRLLCPEVVGTGPALRPPKPQTRPLAAPDSF